MLLLARAADMIERQRCTIGDYNADLTELQRRFNALKATVGAHRRAQYPTQPAEITQVDQQLYSAADVI
jgi:hypothetical protein